MTDTTTMPGWKRNATIFLAGQTVSLLGSMLVQYAVMWHLTITTRSGTVMMWSIVFGMLPQAFVSVLGGVWADRHHRKWLIMGSDTAIAVVTLGLALVMASGVDDLWLIYAALAVRSAFAGVQTPAVSAMIPQVVPEDQLLRINGLNQSIQSAMMLLAPVVAAGIYASFDIVAVFFVDVVTAMIGVGLLALVPVARLVRPTGPGDAPAYLDDLRAGLRYVVRHAAVRWLMVLFAVTMLLVGAPAFLTPLMVARTFGDEVWKLTANEVAWSIGMLGAGLVIAALGPRVKRHMAIIVASVVGAGVFTGLLGLATTMWVFFALGFVVSATYATMFAPAMTLMQTTVEPQYQGRVFGFFGIVMSVGMPLSMVVFGPLADRYSVESLLVVAGALLVAFVGALLALPPTRRSLAALAAAPETTPPETVPPEAAAPETTTPPGTTPPGTTPPGTAASPRTADGAGGTLDPWVEDVTEETRRWETRR
ncbi:MFS transporter [Xylanimonas protaetiae]|uniref:MFS transporter n=1 Tax=Xylanimonas protaetiae TaxID=2509457 RepID=UPI001F5DDF12|nr:MFS transporter [Xylanimonas protaetiae]